MVVDVLARVSAPPDDVVLWDAQGAWTHRELAARVDERAADLDGVGHGPGEVVPVALDADAEGLVTLLALWRVGATPAPLSMRLTEAEHDTARAALAGVPGGAQAVLWTSGTAGQPKGVALSFDALEASARASEQRLALGADDVWLASLSPAHVGGLALLTRALLLGSRLAAVGPFEVEAASALIDGRGAASGVAVTHVAVVPTQLLRLLDARGDEPAPPSLRCVLVGGAAAPAGLVARALEGGWPLALTYGLTEATSQVATAPPDVVRRKPGTVGRPLPGVELTLANGSEIFVRGRTLASGYVATDEPMVDRDGWLHTGDLGRLDDDGDLWVTGRRIDRIVTGGVTVDAVEVEEALRAHPAVRDAGVVGIPDEEWGERVGAWVEPAGDVTAGAEALEAAALDAWLRQRLSAAKLPRVYRVAAGLPRNANGKLDRQAVRDALAARR
jgi:O-succinylbenzoic acid--CoA ligase